MCKNLLKITLDKFYRDLDLQMFGIPKAYEGATFDWFVPGVV